MSWQAEYLVEQLRHLTRPGSSLQRPLKLGQQRVCDRLHRWQYLNEWHLTDDEGEGGDEVDTVRAMKLQLQRAVVHLQELLHRLLLRQVLGALFAQLFHRLVSSESI